MQQQKNTYFQENEEDIVLIAAIKRLCRALIHPFLQLSRIKDLMIRKGEAFHIGGRSLRSPTHAMRQGWRGAARPALHTYIYIIGGIILLLFLISTIILLLPIYHQADIKSALSKQAMVPANKALHNTILKQVNKIVQLPPGQDALVGQIQDVKKLAHYQDYFQKARNGDYLIVYANETIIYDPVNHYIVNIAMANLLTLPGNGE